MASGFALTAFVAASAVAAANYGRHREHLVVVESPPSTRAVAGPSTSIPFRDQALPLPTLGAGGGGSSQLAELQGELQFDGQCFWIEVGAAKSGARVPVLWAGGYTANSQPPRVQDSESHVALVGSIVHVGGGYFSVSGPLAANPCLFGDTRPFFVQGPFGFVGTQAPSTLPSTSAGV